MKGRVASYVKFSPFLEEVIGIWHGGVVQRITCQHGRCYPQYCVFNLIVFNAKAFEIYGKISFILFEVNRANVTSYFEINTIHGTAISKTMNNFIDSSMFTNWLMSYPMLKGYFKKLYIWFNSPYINYYFKINWAWRWFVDNSHYFFNRYIMIAHHSVYATIYKNHWIACMIGFCWIFSYGVLLPPLFEIWGNPSINLPSNKNKQS